MADALTAAYRTSLARVRGLVSGAVDRAWVRLGSYNEPDVPRFLAAAVPVVSAAQRHTASLTVAYLARAAKVRPPAIDTSALTGAPLRNGAAPDEVYRRPFVTVWTALAAGTAWAAAVEAGRARAVATAETDMQLATRATAGAVGNSEDSIVGYRRVVSGEACELCASVAGAFLSDANVMPLHPGCSCTLEPVIGHAPQLDSEPEGVIVHDHGELGPTLAVAGQHFDTLN